MLSCRTMHGDHCKNPLPWRIVFGAAAIYNIAFGAWAVLRPMDFFHWFEMPPPRYPFLWSCLGMVIGVYGLGYAYIARRPERGDVIAALGLIGKTLGPIGWWWSVRNGDIPARTFPMILFNDLIWWYPFGWYLLRKSADHRRVLTAVIVAFHIVASVLLLMMRQGTEAQQLDEGRRSFILAHTPAWTLCWALWVCGSMGLYVFFVMWALELRRRGAAMFILIGCCALVAIGLSLDLANEVIAIAALTDSRLAMGEFSEQARRATVFGAGWANGIYSACGIVLTIVAWRSALQRGFAGLLGFAVWCCGIVLSGAAFAGRGDLMMFFGGALMLLFIPWAAWTGWRFGR